MIYQNLENEYSMYLIDDYCQYWINRADGTLTSPHYDSEKHQYYDHNLNCTWILNADQGFYITLEIDDFQAITNDIYFYYYCNKVYHS